MNGGEKQFVHRVLTIVPGLGIAVVIVLLALTLWQLQDSQASRDEQIDRLLHKLETIAEDNRASVLEHRQRNELLHHELCLALEHITDQIHSIDPPDCPDPIEEPR